MTKKTRGHDQRWIAIIGLLPLIGQSELFNYQSSISDGISADLPIAHQFPLSFLFSFFYVHCPRAHRDSRRRETCFASRSLRTSSLCSSFSRSLKYLSDGPHLRTQWFRAPSLTRLWQRRPEESSVSLRRTWKRRLVGIEQITLLDSRSFLEKTSKCRHERRRGTIGGEEREVAVVAEEGRIHS